MLFWMWVIIAVVAVIIAICAAGDTKEQEEHKRLEQEYKYADEAATWLPFDIDKRTYAAARDKRNAAYKRLKEFENEHPKLEARTRHREYTFNTAMAFFIGAGIVALIIGIVLLKIYICAPAEQARLEAEYEVFAWEIANDVYTDSGDDVVGKKELYNQVREWNAEVAQNHAKAKDFWRGIFVPDFWLDLKPIELK